MKIKQNAKINQKGLKKAKINEKKMVIDPTMCI